VRSAIVRAWTAVATALLTAAVADGWTECAENLGWLGGSARDIQQQSVEPVFLLGIIVAGALAVFVAFAKIASQDPLLRCAHRLRARATDLALALAGSAVLTIAMEGYETRFGGLSPFDPRSVILSHTLPLLVAFVLVAVVVQRGLRCALHIAKQAGQLAASTLVEFLYKVTRPAVGQRAVHASVFALRVLHLPPAIADGACGLRAPPRATLHSCFAT
jgi:hypothetical protein